MAGTPVSSCVRMVLPTADFSPDHEAPGPFPTVTTFSVTSTWATPGSANNRSARGEPAARSGLSKKKGPPGYNGPAHGEFARVGVGEQNLGADRDRRIDRHHVRHL